MSSPSNVAASPSKPRRARADRIPAFGSALAICFQIALLVLFNAFPHKVGVTLSAGDPTTFVPLLGQGFWRLLPWINAALALGLTLNLVHFGLGRWTLTTRWADLGLSVFNCYVLWLLATSGGVLAPGLQEALAGQGWVHSWWLDRGLEWAVERLLWLAFWISVVVTAVKGLGLLLRSAREAGDAESL